MHPSRGVEHELHTIEHDTTEHNQFHQNIRVPKGTATRLYYKHDFRLTGFPKASSIVSGGTAGTNNGEVPATRLHFGLPY